MQGVLWCDEVTLIIFLSIPLFLNLLIHSSKLWIIKDADAVYTQSRKGKGAAAGALALAVVGAVIAAVVPLLAEAVAGTNCFFSIKKDRN